MIINRLKNILKGKTTKTILFLREFPWFLGENVFIFFLAAISLALLLGGMFAYKYVVLFQRQELAPTEKLLSFDKSSLEKVLKAWQMQDERFQAADTKIYPSLFVPKAR
jgi:hypothetical protein